MSRRSKLLEGRTKGIGRSQSTPAREHFCSTGGGEGGGDQGGGRSRFFRGSRITGLWTPTEWERKTATPSNLTSTPTLNRRAATDSRP
jgi:hypothetical protein